mgnify:FL=1
MGADRRRSRARFARACGALAVALALGAVVAPTTVADDDRDAAEAAKEAAEASMNELRAQLEGIDANLAQVFVDLQSLNGQIPEAQTKADEAGTHYDTAVREHAVLEGQLRAAKSEKTSIDSEITQAEQDQSQASAAIGELVRRKYREGGASAVTLALTAEGSASIEQRASAADAALRAETQTVNAALDVQSSQRTQQARQEAITNRIGSLEEQARQAEEDAQAAKQEADSTLAELNTLRADAQAKQTEWDSRKGEVEASLAQAEADYQARSAELSQIDEANQASGATYTSSSGFRSPLDIPIVVTSPFGMRYHPVLGIMKGHSGTDMAADCGTVIRAVASGYVNAVSADVSAGNYVDVNHGMVGGNSVITEYLHMQAQYVSPGQYVNAGDALGEVGSTGYATGCHLHFGVRENGSYVEPMDYL